jgi:hypothetical protein
VNATHVVVPPGAAGSLRVRLSPADKADRGAVVREIALGR